MISRSRFAIISYYLYDGLGSTRALTDSTGNTTDKYTYEAFGNLINKVGTTVNDYLFAGEQYDPNVGFYYLRARYMDTKTGRFLTQDTYEGDNYDPMTLHKYLYCGNDPINRIDPSGNQATIMEMTAISAIMVTLSSISTQIIQYAPQIRRASEITATALALAYILDQVIKSIDLSAAGRAYGLLQEHLRKFKESDELKNKRYKSAQHVINLWGSSGRERTDEKTVWTKKIGTVEVNYIMGGKGGRIMQYEYRLGRKNTTLGAGYFRFRADYLSYTTNPPHYSPHYHLKYGKVDIGGDDENEIGGSGGTNVNHVPL